MIDTTNIDSLKPVVHKYKEKLPYSFLKTSPFYTKQYKNSEIEEFINGKIKHTSIYEGRSGITTFEYFGEPLTIFDETVLLSILKNGNKRGKWFDIKFSDLFNTCGISNGGREYQKIMDSINKLYRRELTLSTPDIKDHKFRIIAQYKELSNETIEFMDNKTNKNKSKFLTRDISIEILDSFLRLYDLQQSYQLPMYERQILKSNISISFRRYLKLFDNYLKLGNTHYEGLDLLRSKLNLEIPMRLNKDNERVVMYSRLNSKLDEVKKEMKKINVHFNYEVKNKSYMLSFKYIDLDISKMTNKEKEKTLLSKLKGTN